MKIKIAVLLVVCFVLSAATACGTGRSGENQSSGGAVASGGANLNALGTLPLVKEKIEIKAVGRTYSGCSPWNELKVFKVMEEFTNIKINFDDVDDGVFVERFTLMLSSGDYPEFFMGRWGCINISDLNKYGPEGVFIDLTDYIANETTYLKSFMEAKPVVYNTMKNLDGKIYSLPVYCDTATSAMGLIYYNKAYNDQLGITKLPTNTDEFYELLVAYRDGIPNSIPLMHYTVSESSLSAINLWLMPAFGLACADSLLGLDGNDVYFVPYQEAYKAYLQYLNKLYNENLLDTSTFTQDYDQYIAKSKDFRCGVLTVAATLSQTPEHTLDYIALPPITSPYNDKQITQNFNKTTIGNFVITDKNKYPVETMRWVNELWRYSETEMLYLDGYGGFSGNAIWLGFEGEGYEWAYTDETKQYYSFIMDLGDLNLVEYLHKYICIGAGPANMDFMTYSVGDDYNALVVRNNENAYWPFLVDVYPPVQHTTEEIERLTIIETDIRTYFRQMEAKFVTGEESFANWESYIETLKKMGADDYLTLKVNAYKRFIS